VPNPAHHALAELERRGLLDGVITQNIDGLHAAAGIGELVEVHGSIAHASCAGCGARHPLEDVRERLAAAPDGVPRCDCETPLKPDVVLFGEMLSEVALARAAALAGGADVLLCVGSSLEVYPVAQLPQITLASGGAVALVTMGPTPYDHHAAVKLGGDVVAELGAVLAALQ
jgi:NAD-dependent deacetylase